ncbi:MAG TPA: tRNA (N(6)-L-threonylcarbamoyladenosine(37)-C(2))-methylthiotransferase MtaB [Paludibacter sp.]|nr:tRNA (N(6)-L-threonylcarbamoyladenosine(37)-C(2))-methylthiotransferase MtaB [Paludibacter sp.]
MIDNSIFINKKVIFHTLGCKLNFAESSAIGKQLMDEGFVKVRAGEQADVCIINTCSVTDTADHKCRQAINRLNRQHPNAVMVVTGCYAQLKPDEIAAIEGVDLVLGANEKFSILDFLASREGGKVHYSQVNKIKEFKPSCSRDDRTRFFLKVQDGCDYHCSYCTIPFARGRSRNATIESTVAMARQAIAEGAREIVLTGVNTGDFGKSTGETFFDLVKALDNLDEDIRFRISSIEPNLLTDEMIGFVAGSRHFMPHFHIPLQSGSDEVLRLMKRRYDSALFAAKVQTINRVMPHAFIGVDVIVGVRGETPELFEETKAFLSTLEFSQLHVFSYSERQGTKMLEVDYVVPAHERKLRSDELHRISALKTKAFYERQMGKTVEVLWESRRHEDCMVGFSGNYVRTERPYDRNLVNTVQTVVLGGWNNDGTALLGE